MADSHTQKLSRAATKKKITQLLREIRERIEELVELAKADPGNKQLAAWLAGQPTKKHRIRDPRIREVFEPIIGELNSDGLEIVYDLVTRAIALKRAFPDKKTVRREMKIPTGTGC